MRTKTKSLFTILLGVVFALALGCMAMSANAQATTAKADGTVFRMTNKAYLRLNADGYAFEVEMDEATHAIINDNL